MSVKLLTEHHLEFLRLKGGCTGSSESTLVRMLQSWKSHVVAHFLPDQNLTHCVLLPLHLVSVKRLQKDNYNH